MDPYLARIRLLKFILARMLKSAFIKQVLEISGAALSFYR